MKARGKLNNRCQLNNYKQTAIKVVMKNSLKSYCECSDMYSLYYIGKKQVRVCAF